MLTSTWTAFETLAGDLWEAALNVRPDRFADFGGDHDRIRQKAQGRQRRALKNGPKFGPSKEFARSAAGKACPRGEHGTYHRENHASFDALHKTRSAYSCAFKSRYAKIDNALCEPCLDALSHVRNLIVHRSGIADARYVKEASAIRGCPRIGLNKSLPLRGDLVARLIKPVVGVSMRLISAVDAEVIR